MLDKMSNPPKKYAKQGNIQSSDWTSLSLFLVVQSLQQYVLWTRPAPVLHFSSLCFIFDLNFYSLSFRSVRSRATRNYAPRYCRKIKINGRNSKEKGIKISGQITWETAATIELSRAQSASRAMSSPQMQSATERATGGFRADAGSATENHIKHINVISSIGVDRQAHTHDFRFPFVFPKRPLKSSSSIHTEVRHTLYAVVYREMHYGVCVRSCHVGVLLNSWV